MLKVLQILFFSLLFAKIGFSLKCYLCDTNQGGCFESGTHHGEEVDCETGFTGCFKVETKIAGVSTFIGSCVEPKPGAKSECKTETSAAGGMVTACLCKEDLCNMSSRIQASLFMTIIVILLASWARICWPPGGKDVAWRMYKPRTYLKILYWSSFIGIGYQTMYAK